MMFSVPNLLIALAFIIRKLNEHTANKRNTAAEYRDEAERAAIYAKDADKEADVSAKLAGNLEKLLK